jgi:hypothetical protein
MEEGNDTRKDGRQREEKEKRRKEGWKEERRGRQEGHVGRRLLDELEDVQRQGGVCVSNDFIISHCGF